MFVRWNGWEYLKSGPLVSIYINCAKSFYHTTRGLDIINKPESELTKDKIEE